MQIKNISNYSLIVIIFGLAILFGLLNPVFLTATNLVNILNQVTILSIVAFGMTLVILIGGIDLSVGSIVAFSGIVLGKCLFLGISVPISILCALIAGSIIGLLNGILITYGKIAPFIATLGTMSAARGLGLLVSSGRSISSFQNPISFIADTKIMFLPMPVVLLIVVFIIFYVFQKHTIWGRYLMAIGGNENAAWLSGIKTNTYKLVVYIICGIASAIGSIILVAKLGSAQPQAGALYELDAIAAAVIGGASLSGGKGSILGTIGGALIIGILQNGLSILNVPSYYQQILIGSIIIIAVLIDKSKNKK